jgi:hypothetical protein
MSDTDTTEPRMFVKIPEEVIERARDLVARGIYASVDEVIETALTGDPTSWPSVMALVRAPVPPSPSPIQRTPPIELQSRSRAVFCHCCTPGPCKNQLRWRGVSRCACAGKDANPPGAGRPVIVQPDLERK